MSEPTKQPEADAADTGESVVEAIHEMLGAAQGGLPATEIIALLVPRGHAEAEIARAVRLGMDTGALRLGDRLHVELAKEDDPVEAMGDEARAGAMAGFALKTLAGAEADVAARILGFVAGTIIHHNASGLHAAGALFGTLNARAIETLALLEALQEMADEEVAGETEDAGKQEPTGEGPG